MTDHLARPESPSSTADREFLVSRLIHAPRELVFDAWTTPEHIAHWWGPDGFTTTTHEMDVRPGGHWRLIMHGPDGRDYLNHIVFDEVVRPERIVYTHVPERGTEPVSFQTTVTFVAHGDKTMLTMRGVFATAAERDAVVRKYGALEGAHQTIARLAGYVEPRVPGSPGRAAGRGEG
jgi:uncharacterized protein YndB with AHSA1/START domain